MKKDTTTFELGNTKDTLALLELMSIGRSSWPRKIKITAVPGLDPTADLSQISWKALQPILTYSTELHFENITVEWAKKMSTFFSQSLDISQIFFENCDEAAMAELKPVLEALKKRNKLLQIVNPYEPEEYWVRPDNRGILNLDNFLKWVDGAQFQDEKEHENNKHLTKDTPPQIDRIELAFDKYPLDHLQKCLTTINQYPKITIKELEFKIPTLYLANFCEKIKELRSGSFKSLAEFIQGNSSVSKLIIDRFSYVYQYDTSRIGATLDPKDFQETLNPSRDEILSLVAAIQQNSTLKALTLNESKLPEEDLALIIAAFNNSQTLETLTINDKVIPKPAAQNNNNNEAITTNLGSEDKQDYALKKNMGAIKRSSPVHREESSMPKVQSKKRDSSPEDFKRMDFY